MLDREYLEGMFAEVEDEILRNNTEMAKIDVRMKLLTQLTGNEKKVCEILDSSTSLNGIVNAKKREFFFETIEMFIGFQNTRDFAREIAMDGLLKALDEVEEKVIAGDEEYLAENDKHNKDVIAFQETLSKSENKILLEILNIDSDMYELHTNILFEVMLILAEMLNRIEYLKKINQ